MGLKVVKILILVIFIGGCTLAATPLNNEKISLIDKVGIVSFIGDEFSYGYMGATVFNNTLHLYEQEFIDFDKEVTGILKRTVEEKLTDNPKPIKVIDVDFDKSKLISSYKQGQDYTEFNIESVADELTDIANEYNLKYLIVVTRGHNAIANGAGRTGGIGISRTMGMPEGRVILHNYLDYKLFEVDTRSTPSFFSTSAMNYGQKRDVEFAWKEPLSEYSESEIVQLEKLVQEDLQYRVPWAITYMLKWRAK